MRWIVTGGEAAEVNYAAPLIEGLTAQAVIADKAYDSDALIEVIEATGATVVIPPKKNHKTPRAYDRHLYKDRNLVERFFNRVKSFRRIATRYEKLALNYVSMLNLVGTMLWLAVCEHALGFSVRH